MQILSDTAKDINADHARIADVSSRENVEYGVKAGIKVLYRKIYWKDYGNGSIRTGLMRYYGNKNKRENEKYADSILKCEKCLLNKCANKMPCLSPL